MTVERCDSSEVAGLMGGLSIFSSFTRPECEVLATALTAARVAKGHELFCEGQAARAMFIVAKGEVTLFKQLGRGRRKIAALGPSNACGHEGLLDRKPNVWTAVATQDSTVLGCMRDAFERLYEADSALALQLVVPIVTGLCRRSRGANGLLRELFADPQKTLMLLHQNAPRRRR